MVRIAGARDRLASACRRYGMRMRLQITDKQGPEHAVVWTCRGQVELAPGEELEAVAQAANVKAARALACVALLEQLATLPPEKLPAPRAVRRRR